MAWWKDDAVAARTAYILGVPSLSMHGKMLDRQPSGCIIVVRRLNRKIKIAFFGLGGHGIVFSRADKAFLRPVFFSFLFFFFKMEKKKKPI